MDPRRTDLRPHLTIVVPTRNRAGLLDGCLEALLVSLNGSDELIVVDSASSDGRSEAVALAHGARYRRCDVPGASFARNAGWRQATHELIAFIDDDVRVETGWADAVAKTFAAHPEATFVTGRIDSPNDRYGGHTAPLKVETQPASLEPSTHGALGHGANLAVRRDALQRVGGFDELLGAGGRFRASEDIDLFDRLLTAGFNGRYEPGASANHQDWRDRRQVLSQQWSYGLGTGARLVKLGKDNPRRLKKAVRESVVDWGLRYLWRMARDRWKFGVAFVSLRLLGMVVGVVRALPYRVQGGHLVDPRDSRR